MSRISSPEPSLLCAKVLGETLMDRFLPPKFHLFRMDRILGRLGNALWETVGVVDVLVVFPESGVLEAGENAREGCWFWCCWVTMAKVASSEGRDLLSLLTPLLALE